MFQIEFDFGVPQFRQVFQPMLIAAAAAFGLVAARIMLGRGAAIIAALLAIALRGGVALVVGPILGAPINWFALYLGPAIVVELIGLTPLIKRPIVFGLVSGLGVATIGLWLESLWIDAVYHYPWPTSIWPEALAMAIPVAVLTGACGAMFGMVLTSQRLPSRAISIGLVVLTVLAIGGATANGLRYNVPQNVTAAVTLTDVPGGPGQRMVNADVRINPPNFVSDNPNWVSILAWQGHLAEPARRGRHQSRKAWTRSLPHHRTRPGVGYLEDAAAGARRKDVGRGADLPCRATLASARRRCRRRHR